MNNIDWSNLFKIRLSNIIDESMDKHDIIKLLIVRKILRKYKSNKNWIRVYTEHSLNSMKPDIYFEDIKKKSVICYEIQKQINKKYIKEKTEQYDSYDVPYMNSIDLIIVSLKEAPNNIEELNLWLDDYIF